jgi:hypothetical protein
MIRALGVALVVATAEGFSLVAPSSLSMGKIGTVRSELSGVLQASAQLAGVTLSRRCEA